MRLGDVHRNHKWEPNISYNITAWSIIAPGDGDARTAGAVELRLHAPAARFGREVMRGMGNLRSGGIRARIGAAMGVAARQIWAESTLGDALAHRLPELAYLS